MNEYCFNSFIGGYLLQVALKSPVRRRRRKREKANLSACQLASFLLICDANHISSFDIST
jgi:hypothetical protein